MSTQQPPQPGYWLASDGNWYPPAPVPVAPSPKKRLKVRWAVLAVAAVFFLLMAVGWMASSQGTSTNGTEAAMACLNAHDAATQYMAGSRSSSSTLSALQGAESLERTAVDANAKYQVVLDDIVGLEAGLTSGDASATGVELSLLNIQCG